MGPVATAEHGILGLSTPWTRDLFPGDLRAEAAALIPAGYQINVAAVNGRPGPWRLIGYRWSGDQLVELMEWVTHSPRQMVAAMAERLHDLAATAAP